ncbi:RTA1 like protein-domain-containing protein [Mycena haematopus]|nr:RTA1 like protein-domain-containing protein [Mycena haematopus]
MSLSFSPYGYTPTEYVCTLYVGLFALSTILHIGQATYYRLWWLFPSVIFAGVMETVGWAGRVWSSKTPQMFQAYEMQIVCTVMGPTPLAAANFIILGRIINLLSPGYSRMSPKLYMILFLCCDVISLVIQAIGGGMAATAVNEGKDPTLGGNVMLGGIIFQTVTIYVFVLCAVEFLVRYLNNWPLGSSASGKTQVTLGPKIKLLLCALGFTTTCLFIRAVYRVIELSDGWSGRIIQTQVYFNVLDGAMITLAMFTINIAHPGIFLATLTVDEDAETESEARNNDQNWVEDTKNVA